MEARVQKTLDRISVPVHSCVRIESRHPGVIAYVDPFRIDGTPHDADLVLITHDHYDHFSPEDIAKVRKPGTAFVLPQAMDRRDLPIDRAQTEVHFLAPYSECTVFGIPVHTVPAYNVSKGFHPEDNSWLGYFSTSSLSIQSSTKEPLQLQLINPTG